ncbi:MAG: PQQ-binding-like beta-propeller repeat protein [Planctomycetota bacterium]
MPVRGQIVAMSVVLGALAVGLAPSIHAENWTRFRGPNGNGIATSVSFPATWTNDDYLWKIDLPGVGHSSPVGWGDRLFVTTGDTETGDITLHALSPSTGAQQWQQVFDGNTYAMHAGNSYASSTPAVDEHHVYFAWSAGGRLHCAALGHDGNEIWRTELGDFIGPHGFAASPMVVEGVVCVQVDHADAGYLIGIDAQSGEVRWRADRPAGKASYATPCVLPRGETGDAVVISQSMEGGLQLIDALTGTVVWQNATAFPARCVSSPMLVGETLVSICGGGGRGKLLVGMDVSAGPTQPTEKLTLTKQLPYVPTPLRVGNRALLWLDQGMVSMVDLSANGPPKKAVWTERVGGKFFGSPILAGDKVYCLSMDGRAVVIAADDEFELLGDNDLGHPSNATPAVHQDRLYLRTESTLACLGQE